MRARAIVPLLAFVVCTAASPEPSVTGPASPDPYAIFARARQYFEAQRYPQFIDYDVAVDVVEAGKDRVERYASAYDATNGSIWVDPVSDYEIAHPPSGRGVNVSIFGLGGKPEPPIDFLGVPRVAPTYSFGIAKFVAAVPPGPKSDEELVAEVRQAFHDPNPRARALPTSSPAATTGLREIASVTVYKRDYRITLVGEEAIDGVSCYHLVLAPVRARDDRLRLRDVWIDERTSATVRLREARNFTSGPGTTVSWTVDFDDVAGAHYIARERAEVPMSYRGLLFTQATISFENIRARARPVAQRDTPVTNGLVMEEPGD